MREEVVAALGVLVVEAVHQEAGARDPLELQCPGHSESAQGVGASIPTQS